VAERIDVRALARRVVGRVMAERGQTPIGQPGPATGVFVTVEPGGGTLRPAVRKAAPASGRGSELVTADMVAQVKSGAALRIEPSAIVTALARDEAWKRGIRIEQRATQDDGGRLRVAVGADHGGFALKADVIELVRSLGHEAFDLGTRDENPVDYPDYAKAVADSVARDNADVGIMIDGAGIGSAMAANKIAGVRAANCWSVAVAKNAREHNYANVLTLGAKMIARDVARDVVRTFLTTPFGEERHGKRVAKITALERESRRAQQAQP
jgi:ribose 5-phosphate isomerase B